jgi:hypothetical protein
MKGFKFRPVAWMAGALTALTALEAVDQAVHILPAAVHPYVLGGIAVLTAVLGKLAHDRVTPLAAPKDNGGTPLIPKPMAPSRERPAYPTS